MRNAELATCAYAQLAWLSQQKRQALARDRFLVLAGASACEAQWLDVAEACHRLLVKFAPRHLLSSFASFAEAMHAEAVQQLVRATGRHCSYERAEHLLQELGFSPDAIEAGEPRHTWARELLTRPEWFQ
uniref:Uncharacterized protein n=1 Tax=Schlesneria paludicola TaxID=360056 RepID=A0A7C4QJ12_9PLAN